MSNNRVIAVTSTGQHMPLTLEGGVPCCPLDGVPMTEVEPGWWQCSFHVAAVEHVSRAIAEKLDRDLDAFIAEHGSALSRLRGGEASATVGYRNGRCASRMP